MLDSVLGMLCNPGSLVPALWRKVPVGSFERRLRYDIFPRPHYAYCIYHGARLAKMLGYEAISVLEFGVAGGNGLVEMERLADQVKKLFDVQVHIYGFDTGGGLPEPIDYRDLPYVWQPGFYEIDFERLEKRLKGAEVIFGDVSDTLGDFLSRKDLAPIGAVAFDLDYYSSTVSALKIFETHSSALLPRAFCYFDDVISSENGIHCEEVGPLLAIREYNEKSDGRHLGQISGFKGRRSRPAGWNEQIYVHHDFNHPDYSTYIHPDGTRQLTLD